MQTVNNLKPPRARLWQPRVLGGGLGLAIFVYYVTRIGLKDVTEGVAKIGLAFPIILALSGLRFAVRTLAWMRCIEGETQLRFKYAYPATLVGDALGNLTPLSLLVSEPAKAMFVRTRASLAHTLPALAIENIFYTLSVILVIASGFMALLLRFQTTVAWWLPGASLLATFLLLVCAVHWVIWNHLRLGSGTLDWLHRHRLLLRISNAQNRWNHWYQQIHELETRTFSLYPRDRARLLPLLLFESLFHVLAIAEVYLVITLLTESPPTLLDAFLFESANRFINAAFRFVPLRLGVDELGTGTLATLLAVGATIGVTLAIIRKARMLFWITVGVACLIGKGLSVRDMLDEAEVTRTTSALTDPNHKAQAREPRPENNVPESIDVAIVVMARSPLTEGARIKTRLASSVPIDADRIALYEAFLFDILQSCRTMTNVVLRVAYTPEGGHHGFTALGVSDDELIPQRGANLGERERQLFEDLFSEGFKKVVIIGSDSPTLPMSHVRDAITKLSESRLRSVVLGPSNDGGYYLIALSASPLGNAVPDLFTNIRWGAESALNDTVRASYSAGLQVELLPKWYDVDDEQGISQLRTDLQDPQQAALAPQTTAMLQRIFQDKKQSST